MDTSEFIRKDKIYLKCKFIVKNWEKDFKEKYSRTPSRFDIKEAPSKIKYAYKKYFQLKSAALENTLLGYDIDQNDESFMSPEPLHHLDSICDDSLNSPLEQSLPTLPSGQELEVILLNENVKKTETPNDDKALSLDTCNLNNDNALNLFTNNLSKKLFENKKFTLRNPRKSFLSKTQPEVEIKMICVDKHHNSKESSRTLLNIENMQLNNSVAITNNLANNETVSADILLQTHRTVVTSPGVRQLNEAWLERATGLVLQDIAKDIKIKGSEKMKGIWKDEKFGLNNIKLSQTKDESCDYVENSESEEDVKLEKLKPALKKKKIESYSSSSIAAQNESLSEYKICKLQPEMKKSINDKNAKRKTKTKIEQELTENPPDISEYLPFGLIENVTPRLSKVSSVPEIKNLISDNTVNIKELTGVKEINNLEKKLKNGTINENFVKIKIEKKVFVRGKKNINYSKYKKQQWKDRKALNAGMEFPESGKVSCYKCGIVGHMARYCTSHKGETLLPLESFDENDLPTLQDMQSIISEEGNSLSLEQLNVSIFEPSSIPDTFKKLLAETKQYALNTDIRPIYFNYQQETPKELYEALHMFGYKSFRPGQEQTIMRILCGMSTLLILSTGGGKSLCYQIPAYIYSKYYKCITLVISPLVSLMEDQVLNMPEFLKAGCLHTNQPPTHRHKILQCIKEGKINILLISPETLVSGDVLKGFTSLFKSLPPIAFACIDEAHCVSQWSHNFRPSYLMICRVLKEKLNIKCILGLTATASHPTIKSIISHINTPDGLNGVIVNPSLPDNLCLSVSLEKDKDRALISYLTSERIKSFNSIIVYCIRRDECERVAAILRSCLQENSKINMERQSNKRKRMSFIAEAYHAGMSAAQRKKIQSHFINGTLKIIVATVAFGMGINKSNIRCIVHYNTPKNFESYVQEVGRAGRDGQLAYCHVLMNDSNVDKNELLKHIYANTIDRPTLRKLLQKVFVPCECKNKDQEKTSSSLLRCTGHEVGIPIDNTVEELDLPSENIATLLCYLELHSKKYIKVLNNAYVKCKIISYGGPQKIIEAIKRCPPLAMAYLIKSKKDPDVTKNSNLEFNVIEIAAAIGWESGMTKYCLKNLEWVTENGISKRSQLKVEFNTLGFRIKAPGDLTSTELDCMLDDLHDSVLFQEKVMLSQLEESNRVFKNFGNYSVENGTLSDDILINRSKELKTIIINYFQRQNSLPADVILEERPLDVDRVLSDVQALMNTYKDCKFTGRSIARIFQGISSPNYPALVWGKCKFWRSHIHEDFYGIMKIATQHIIQMKII